jgi:hypothetical protein
MDFDNCIYKPLSKWDHMYSAVCVKILSTIKFRRSPEISNPLNFFTSETKTSSVVYPKFHLVKF